MIDDCMARTSSQETPPVQVVPGADERLRAPEVEMIAFHLVNNWKEVGRPNTYKSSTELSKNSRHLMLYN